MVLTEDYNAASPAFRREIAAMLRRIWPDCGGEEEVHDARFRARSFYCRMDGVLAGYAAVLRQDIVHGGIPFRLAGLSCVATAPEFRRRGVGRRLVSAASCWMAEQPELDFGIFTCHPALAPFYCEAGGWEVAPDVVLIGNSEPGALSSSALGVAVLMRLFSAGARACEAQLRHGVINLGFPPGQFL